jgi:hypothetical protein
MYRAAFDVLSGHDFSHAANAIKAVRLQPLRFCFPVATQTFQPVRTLDPALQTNH